MLALAGCDRLTISPGLLEQMEASTDEVREGGEGGGARKRGGGRERGDRERGGMRGSAAWHGLHHSAADGP